MDSVDAVASRGERPRGAGHPSQLAEHVGPQELEELATGIGNAGALPLADGRGLDPAKPGDGRGVAEGHDDRGVGMLGLIVHCYRLGLANRLVNSHS